jgi:hypothetical protein
VRFQWLGAALALHYPRCGKRAAKSPSPWEKETAWRHCNGYDGDVWDAVRVRAQRESAQAVIASTIGTTIEWYDFFIYGTAAGLIFG